MAPLSVTYSFSPAATILSAQVNQNFTDIVNWVNVNAIRADAAVSFTSIPSASGSVTSAGHLTTKSYVDGLVKLRPRAHGTAAMPARVGGTVDVTATQLLLQAFTATGSTDGSGLHTVNWPTAFPNGILSVQLTNSNVANFSGHYIVNSITLATLVVKALHTYNLPAASIGSQVDVLALGW